MSNQERQQDDEYEAVGRSYEDVPEEERLKEVDEDGHGEGSVSDDGLESVRPWRVARSLNVLLAQVNAKAPNRNKASDGSIGDAKHRERTSDHNPWIRDGNTDVVSARDITHDPAHGCDANDLAEKIRASKDPRVKYIIWNRRIASSSAIGSNVPWVWRNYTGKNGHTHHIHISVKSDKASYDSDAPWAV